MRFSVLILVLALAEGLPSRGGIRRSDRRLSMGKASMKSRSSDGPQENSGSNDDLPPLVKPPGICTADEPCGRCEGHCRRDDDCSGDLICFFKDADYSGGDSVPGCTGSSPSTTDWCTVGERNDNDLLPLLTPVRTCTGEKPCGRCEGHCSGDDVCEGDLVCFLKDEGIAGEDSVPGCTGTSLSKTDWCTTSAAISGTV